MSYANGIISAPIDVSDPYYVMGVGQYNGWWDMAYICGNEHGKINPAAKYKPVRNSGIVIDRDGEWWKGEDGNCGVLIERLFFPTGAGQEPYQRWRYISIPEDDIYFFNIIDYKGYNHYATFPFRTVLPRIIHNASFMVRLIKNMNINGSRDDMLNISDMSILDINQRRITLDKLYFTIIIREVNTSMLDYRSFTTPTPIMDNKSGDPSDIILTVPGGILEIGKKYDLFLALTTLNQGINYNSLYHLNYDLNGISNKGFYMNVQITEGSKALPYYVQWYKLELGAGTAEGVYFNYHADDITLIDQSKYKMTISGIALADRSESFILDVDKKNGQYSGVLTEISLAWRIDPIGYAKDSTVNVSVYEMINDDWSEIFTQKLPV